MLETELNDSEPSGEERSGASSPEINTAAGQTSADSPPAGADEAPAVKGRRRSTRRPARAKASGKDAAPPDAPPAGSGVAPSGPEAAPSSPEAAGPSAIRFASPAAGAPAATSAPAGAAEAA